VSGDQWPIFLYQGYSYDPDDPWNGLFRSALLVAVRFVFVLCQPAEYHDHPRPINTYSPLLVPSIRNLKLLGPAMRAFMG
jgi:hypothetical protein